MLQSIKEERKQTHKQQSLVAKLKADHERDIAKYEERLICNEAKVDKLKDTITTVSDTALSRQRDSTQAVRDMKATQSLNKQLKNKIAKLEKQLRAEEESRRKQEQAHLQWKRSQEEALTKTKSDLRLFQRSTANFRQSSNEVTAQQAAKIAELQAERAKPQQKKRKVKTAVNELKTRLDQMDMSEQKKEDVCQQLLAAVISHSTTVTAAEPEAVSSDAQRMRKVRARDKLQRSTGVPYSDLKSYFADCPAHEILALLPESFISLLQQQGAAGFSFSLSSHWTYLIGAYLIKELSLSRRKYELLRKVLFKRYNHNTGVYEKLQLNGVCVPQPPSYPKIVKWRQLQLSEYDVDVVQLSDTAATVSINKMLTVSLSAEVDNGHYVVLNGKLVSAATKTMPIVQVSFDAAHTCRGRKTTAFAVKFINGALSNVYKYTHTFALLEGGDDHEQISKSIGTVIQEVNEFIARSTISYGDLNVVCDVYGTADQAAVHATHGMCGSNHMYACPFCECPNSLFSTVQEAQGYPPRTLKQLRLLAHLDEGECPGCKHTITADPKSKEEMKVYNEGMKTPKVPAKFKAADGKLPTWNILHKGKRYGVAPLLNIEPERWVICILHLQLRIVGTMFKKTVFENLTNKPGDLKRAKALYECLLTNSIPIDRVKQTSSNCEDYYDSISKHGFAGEDCSRLLLIYPTLLEILFPSAEREELGRSTRESIDNYLAVWQYWSSFLWPLINEKVADKKAKAASVQDQATVFCRLWKIAFGSTPTLYMHLLTVHLPQQIAALAIDPLYFSLQGLENCNKRRKQFKTLSNCHKVTKTIQIKSYVRKDGSKVPARSQSSGPTMCTQRTAVDPCHFV